MSRPERLTAASIRRAAAELAGKDQTLKAIYQRFGAPPMWKRPGTFATLARIVLEQQVSLDSAKKTFDRLQVACGGRVDAASITNLGSEEIRQNGVTRQKTRYLISLSNDVLNKRFSVGSLAFQDDQTVRQRITARLGMGVWTADVYLLLVLMRQDILPIGDLALVNGISELEQIEYGNSDDLIERAEKWRPYRSVATRMVWQQYLYNRGRKVP